MDFRPPGATSYFSEGELALFSNYIVRQTHLARALTPCQKILVFQRGAIAKGNSMISLGLRRGIQSIVDFGNKLVQYRLVSREEYS